MTAGASVRLLAVDPHELITWGLRSALTQQPWVERCLQANDLAQASRLAAHYTPHVILVDGSLAEGEGEFHDLRQASPTSRLVVMTERPSVPARLLQTVRACGFVSKSWGIEDIVAAVRLAGLGLGLAPPELSGDIPQLTVREEQVLTMIARGETNDQIALDLKLSPNTIKQHASSAYRKLDAHNRTEAVRRAQFHGLIT
ncbi:response regulator transcription factor [Solirubrobacter phytolaccae]|uniref:Response regulator transcription factor n=1 Tax=Solirubrobacter phytolaccae TaxID=1404360 RepID=A0A9X3SCM1_9ACTN|nr:response regulator transcription factor [Solirubrobacter phytolaccae]MDA0182690.1 response regulator transcription factor [Solirubrobacter phytolaccae]